MKRDALAKLRAVALERGLVLVERPNGHVQITGGPLLVNYYPTSPKRSAYVAGTVGAKHHVTPEQAVAMAFVPPPIANAKARDKRGRQAGRRRRLWQRLRAKLCHWCRLPMPFADATIDHVIPLARGGLDNDNNAVLAHARCNHARGHDMPEVARGVVG